MDERQNWVYVCPRCEGETAQLCGDCTLCLDCCVKIACLGAVMVPAADLEELLAPAA